MNTGHSVNTLRASFAPSVLNADTIELLLDTVQIHRLAAGRLTLSPTEQAPAWWLVTKGRIVVGNPGAQSGLVESRVVEPGQWFDIASAWSGPDWMELAVCRTPVTLWAFPLTTLVTCCGLDPDFAHAMGRVLSTRIRQLTEGRHELATKDVLARVALWLLRQVRESAVETTTIRLREQKQSIARQLAMAQETLSRTLRRLVDLGFIDVDGYVVLIRDLRGLQAIAGTPAA